MSLAYVVAKLFVKCLFVYTLAAILDFAIYTFSRHIKNAIPFCRDYHDILSQNQVKNQF